MPVTTRFVVSVFAAFVIGGWLIADGLNSGPWWLAAVGVILCVALVWDVARAIKQANGG